MLAAFFKKIHIHFKVGEHSFEFGGNGNYLFDTKLGVVNIRLFIGDLNGAASLK